METKREMSKSIATGLLLAACGGYLDAYSYLARGGVFANAQTGNIVLLGINAAQRNYSALVHYAIPIFAFSLGILVSEFIKWKFRYSSSIHWRQIIIFAEMVLLLISGFLPVGEADMAVNTAISFVCAMQVETFRVISGNKIATTMCTGNLRSGVELLFFGIKNKSVVDIKNSAKYFLIIAFFIIGAVLGSIFTGVLGAESVFVCCGILAVVLLLMFIK